MNLQPILGVILRSARLWKHDINLLLFSLYWPLLDIMIWGFLGSWMQQAQNIPNFAAVTLLGILLLQFAFRAPNTIVMSFMEEIWADNLVNLFSLPLKISEWIVGITLFTAFVSSVIALFSITIMWLLYNISLSKILLSFGLFAPPLFICGIWLGFMGLLTVTFYGKRAQEFGFILVWFFAPFSGGYYPIEALPHWARIISSFLPMSYLLEGMRNYVLYGANPTNALIQGYALAILYTALAIAFFVYAFKKTKVKGLARLSN
jgi:ABC-2 type transport system permease protein